MRTKKGKMSCLNHFFKTKFACVCGFKDEVNSSDEKEAKTQAALQAILNKTNPQALTKKSKDGILKLVHKREQSIEEEMSKVIHLIFTKCMLCNLLT